VSGTLRASPQRCNCDGGYQAPRQAKRCCRTDLQFLDMPGAVVVGCLEMDMDIAVAWRKDAAMPGRVEADNGRLDLCQLEFDLDLLMLLLFLVISILVLDSDLGDVVGGRLSLSMKGLNCRSAERSTRDHSQSDCNMSMHGVFSWSTKKNEAYCSRAQRPISEHGAPGSLNGVEDG
jgi:hypothetical protein